MDRHALRLSYENFRNDVARLIPIIESASSITEVERRATSGEVSRERFAELDRLLRSQERPPGTIEKWRKAIEKLSAELAPDEQVAHAAIGHCYPAGQNWIDRLDNELTSKQLLVVTNRRILFIGRRGKKVGFVAIPEIVSLSGKGSGSD
jgi:hypothetical protein